MNTIRLAAVVAIFFVSAVAERPAGQAMTVAFEGVNVVPMDRERVLTKQTVLVRDGTIAAMGASGSVQVPGGATRVDARGKFLIPALAEMHAHIPGGDATPEAMERVLFMYVANGIGTIRGMLGAPAHLPLRGRAARGEVVSPTIYTSGPSFSGATAATAEVAVKMVADQKAAGYDFLKIHPGVPRGVFDHLAATADRLGIRFAGHVPADVGLARALEARFATIDHLDGYVEALTRSGAPASSNFGANLLAYVDESRIAALVAQTRAAGTQMVATQILLENWLGPDDPQAMAKWPEMKYAAPGQVTQWMATKQKYLEAYSADDRRRFIALRRRLIKALHDGGVPFLLGSDAPQTWNVPGFSIHRELGTMVAAGLTPYQALATGTRNVAAFFGTLDRTGIIETGKRADVVLVDGNPLEDVANASRIAGVLIGGRWLGKAEIDRRLDLGT